MSITLDGSTQIGKAGGSIALREIAGLDPRQTVKWSGAELTIYSCADLSWSRRKVEFSGYITSASIDPDTATLVYQGEVRAKQLQVPLLTTEFTGGGGLTGDADKRGVLHPAGFGVCFNIPPVWFDAVRWIGMIDGYSNTLSIDGLMEGASTMGAAVANYATYAALAAAIDADAVPPGRWATCVAQGLVGLGAPPVYPIGVNATFGAGLVGAMMKRVLLTHADIDAGLVDTGAFDTLDVAVPHPAHYWTDSQRDCSDLVEALAASANATPFVNFQGLTSVARAVPGASAATLDRSGSIEPRVLAWKTASPVAPFWRIKARAARPANVLTYDEVNYVDTIIDRGLWSPTETYRAGNLVWLDDGTRWLYINDTPTAGNVPETGSAYWAQLTGGGGGIATDRWPSPPPTDWREGSIYFDEENHPFRFEGLDLYNGDEQLFNGALALQGSGYVSVRDRTLIEAVALLLRIDDDGILTIDEKIRIIIPENARLEAAYQGALARAVLLGIDAAAMTTARTAWVTLRDGLTPAWNDTSQDSPITRTDWDLVLATYRTAIEITNTAVAAPSSIVVVPPSNQTVTLDSDGLIVVGQYPRTLTPVVKRGAIDIRADTATLYAITASGINASVNTANGDPDKGKITVTGGTGGYIDLTVTTNGVSFGPYRILFTTDAVPVWLGNDASGKTELGNGIVLTWREIEVPKNADAVFFAYGNGHNYSSFAHASISGGEGGANAQDNNPYIDMGAGGDQLGGAYISSARDALVTCKLTSIGL